MGSGGSRADLSDGVTTNVGERDGGALTNWESSGDGHRGEPRAGDDWASSDGSSRARGTRSRDSSSRDSSSRDASTGDSRARGRAGESDNGLLALSAVAREAISANLLQGPVGAATLVLQTAARTEARSGTLRALSEAVQVSIARVGTLGAAQPVGIATLR